jgi:aminomethyltransferase
MEAAAALRRTPLYDEHVAAGAKLVPFSGWEMPVQYEGVRQEHLAVRTGCGVFDVSHMGQVITEGPQAEALLQRLLSNDVAAIEAAGAQYAVICREDGGILDDVFSYRLAPDHFLTVTNASNHEKDFSWMASQAGGFDAEVRDVASEHAMLAIQGPEARRIAGELFVGKLPPRMRTATLPLRDSIAGGAEALVCGTGYTGEDGVEVLLPPDAAPELWRALVEAGATPAGLAARDTLRLEVCFHLYGNDIDESRNPIEAGLGWVCREQTGFIGAEAVAKARGAEEGAGADGERLVPFVITGAGIPRQGNPVVRADDVVGEVTSGTHSPCLEQGIGMAYVRAELAEPGTEVEIDVRGKRRPARIESRPLYERSSAEAAPGG